MVTTDLGHLLDALEVVAYDPEAAEELFKDTISADEFSKSLLCCLKLAFAMTNPFSPESPSAHFLKLIADSRTIQRDVPEAALALNAVDINKSIWQAEDFAAVVLANGKGKKGCGVVTPVLAVEQMKLLSEIEHRITIFPVASDDVASDGDLDLTTYVKGA